VDSDWEAEQSDYKELTMKEFFTVESANDKKVIKFDPTEVVALSETSEDDKEEIRIHLRSGVIIYVEDTIERLYEELQAFTTLTEEE
jgi:hypothetical protein